MPYRKKTMGKNKIRPNKIKPNPLGIISKTASNLGIIAKKTHKSMFPKLNPKHKRRYFNEVKKWGVNEAKWKAAAEFCVIKGWKWQILTEDTLNNTK